MDEDDAAKRCEHRYQSDDLTADEVQLLIIARRLEGSPRLLKRLNQLAAVFVESHYL